MAAAAPVVIPSGTMHESPAPTIKKTSSILNPSPMSQARLIVELPADAKLYVDGQLTQSTSERRVFNTPALQRGETYYYIVRADVVRDGVQHTESKRIIIRAGQEVRATFSDLDQPATARASINRD
jgi:uncharacterized protein (TIGR03000 family)